MAGALETPLQSIEQLFDFLVEWHDISSVEPVDLPVVLPTQLQQLYQRFGRAASWDNGDHSPEGLFCCQDFLIAPTQIEANIFIPDQGACAGERMLTFCCENQGCFFLHASLDDGDDPMVFKSNVLQPGDGAGPVPLQSIEERLGSVLVSLILQETVLGAMLYLSNPRIGV